MTTSTAPARDVTLALVAGFAGSGKSEAGKLLAAATGWAMLDKDTLTRPLAEQLLVSLGGDPDDRHSSLYLEHVRPLEYACLMKTAWENVECGVSVVLVAPFIKEAAEAQWMARVERRCRRLGGKVEAFWVDSDVETMRERLISRNASRDTWKLTNWSEYVAGVDLSLRPAVDHRLVDNRRSAVRPLAEQMEAAAAQMLVSA